MNTSTNQKDLLWRRYHKHADEYGPWVARIFYYLVKRADPVTLQAIYHPQQIMKTLAVGTEDIKCFELWLTRDNFIFLLSDKVEFRLWT